MEFPLARLLGWVLRRGVNFSYYSRTTKQTFNRNNIICQIVIVPDERHPQLESLCVMEPCNKSSRIFGIITFIVMVMAELDAIHTHSGYMISEYFRGYLGE